MSALSGMDRLLGGLFGAVRGIILVALFVIGGQFAGFDNDDWWQDSRLLPHVQVVADWIKVMAPQGLEIITPDEAADSLPIEV
jgi:membrane protein required for colicin V production